jgi:hypothetical protein
MNWPGPEAGNVVARYASKHARLAARRASAPTWLGSALPPKQPWDQDRVTEACQVLVGQKGMLANYAMASLDGLVHPSAPAT